MHSLFPQHLQVTDKRTCWHGHAGGGLSADPKNVVSTEPRLSPWLLNIENYCFGKISYTVYAVWYIYIKYKVKKQKQNNDNKAVASGCNPGLFSVFIHQRFSKIQKNPKGFLIFCHRLALHVLLLATSQQAVGCVELCPWPATELPKSRFSSLSFFFTSSIIEAVVSKTTFF